jgi:hypothetical protein
MIAASAVGTARTVRIVSAVDGGSTSRLPRTPTSSHAPNNAAPAASAIDPQNIHDRGLGLSRMYRNRSGRLRSHTSSTPVIATPATPTAGATTDPSPPSSTPSRCASAAISIAPAATAFVHR